MQKDCTEDFSGTLHVQRKISRLDAADDDIDIVDDILLHPDGLGVIRNGYSKHFYSSGAFNLIQLIFFVLKQTGPAHLFLTSYSISMDSITALRRKLDAGDILSARFLIDNRVRSISPKPFDFLISSFPGCYRCCALHAKVALIWNDRWHVSVVGSQNATHNPKLERGIIHTDKTVFDFDYKTLCDEFDRGAT
ncbi:hypothetical protein [uncultured Bacteroides sp.]|uniref:hypothetical protein n=1 Tax=uncultured Bacteroides sp. TaxID=162156 RepID=UPI0026055B79|nr:hypothetical protein [uncultured Bacteroides sp.]